MHDQLAQVRRETPFQVRMQRCDDSNNIDKSLWEMELRIANSVDGAMEEIENSGTDESGNEMSEQVNSLIVVNPVNQGAILVAGPYIWVPVTVKRGYTVWRCPQTQKASLADNRDKLWVPAIGRLS